MARLQCKENNWYLPEWLKNNLVFTFDILHVKYTGIISYIGGENKGYCVHFNTNARVKGMILVKHNGRMRYFAFGGNQSQRKENAKQWGNEKETFPHFFSHECIAIHEQKKELICSALRFFCTNFHFIQSPRATQDIWVLKYVVAWEVRARRAMY